MPSLGLELKVIQKLMATMKTYQPTVAQQIMLLYRVGGSNCLEKGGKSPPFQEAVLDSALLNNLYPVSEFLILGEIVEKLIGTHPQRTMKEADYLDPFSHNVSYVTIVR